MSVPACEVVHVALMVLRRLVHMSLPVLSPPAARVVGNTVVIVLHSGGSSAQPTEMLPAPTSHQIAASILLDHLSTFRTGLGIGSDPIHCLAVVPSLGLPGSPHVASARRMRLSETRKAELKSAAANWLAALISVVSNSIAAVRNARTPLHIRVVVHIRFQQRPDVFISDSSLTSH